MAKIGKGQNRTLSGNDPKLRVNLKEIFGVNLKGKPDLRKALGQALIDKIIERTTKNSTDINDSGFQEYSDTYKKSLDYKAAGKGQKVNMTLSGNMLGLVDILAEGANTVTLGWDDDDEAAKAHGHITGHKDGPGVKRDFFGLSEKDVRDLKRSLSPDIKAAISADRKKDDESFNNAVLSILEKVGG